MFGKSLDNGFLLVYNQTTINIYRSVPIIKAGGISRVRQDALRLVGERQMLERVLIRHRRLLRGSLLERPKFCLKSGCKCTRGEPHPPSLYLSHRVEGTARHVFIRSADHERARREALAYKEFRRALRRWRAIDRELDRLWETLGQSQEESYPFDKLRAGSFDKLRAGLR